MDIFKIARKLEPLAPKAVEYWRCERDFCSPDLRTLLDRELLTIAHEKLGNLSNKLLLSLPTEDKARGIFNLGTVVYENEKWPAGISKGELLQHVGVFGRSGAGKTNFAFHLLEQLTEKSVAWLFLDWKKTARHVLPYLGKPVHIFTPGRSLSPFVFNPFIPPPGLDTNIYTNQLIDVLASAYSLGDGAKTILRRALVTCYKELKHWPTATDVLSAVERMKLNAKANNWRTSTIRALEAINFAHFSSATPQKQNELIKILTRSRSIVELDGINVEGKKFLIPMLCLWLYHYRLNQSEREQLKLAIFVEEAHHTFYRQERRAREAVMDTLVRQGREVGMAFVIVDQHPHLISSAALGNTYTKVCMNISDPTDINKAAGLCLLDEEEKKSLSRLPIGQAIVKLQDRWREPFLVRIQHMPFKKGAITEEILKASMRNSRASGLVMNNFEGIERIRFEDRCLSSDELEFLEDVVKRSGDSVSERYKRLAMSGERGTKVKERLIREGWLTGRTVKQGRTRKLMLKVSEAGKEALGLNETDAGRGSLAHEYWKHYYARQFRELGFETRLEATRVGGRVDVLAFNHKERVGIEIETGKSNVVENVKNGLKSILSRILVIATDKAALKRIEEQLAQAGMLIPNRMTVLLAGDRVPN